MSQASTIAMERPRARSGKVWGFLLIAARVVLGVIFVYAAYTKLHYNGAWHLRDYYFLFAMGIDSYRMLPLGAVEWMARLLPWLELGVGGLLIIGAGVRWAGLVVTALLLVFMVALAHAALGGLEINCGCFGTNSVRPGRELVLDGVLLALALGVTVGGFLSHRAGKSPV
jgi:putative oxidoreductase